MFSILVWFSECRFDTLESIERVSGHDSKTKKKTLHPFSNKDWDRRYLVCKLYCIANGLTAVSVVHDAASIENYNTMNISFQSIPVWIIHGICATLYNIHNDYFMHSSPSICFSQFFRVRSLLLYGHTLFYARTCGKYELSDERIRTEK